MVQTKKYNLKLLQPGRAYINLFAYSIFKELFKVNQIDIPEYQYYLGCNAKRTVRLTFLEKSSYFKRNYRIIRLFYFQKYRNFIGSRSCSKWTKMISQTTSTI